MNMVVDNMSSSFACMLMCEKTDKRRRTERRKNYMRNIFYAENNIERNDENDGYGYYESPWCQ